MGFNTSLTDYAQPSTIKTPSFNRFFPSRQDNPCISKKWVQLHCDHKDHNYQHNIQVKCLVRELKSKNCIHCQDLRRSTIIAKAIHRFNQLNWGNYTYFTLWTLGTDLDDTPGNREIMKRYWNLFGSRCRTYSKRENWRYSPIMNAVERGLKGGKLHYHFINHQYLDHKRIISIWRDITGLNANVNFSFNGKTYKLTPRNKDSMALKLFGYLAKYIAKDGLKYYFMGKMLKNATNRERPKTECDKVYAGNYYMTNLEWRLEFIDKIKQTIPYLEPPDFIKNKKVEFPYYDEHGNLWA